MWIFSTILWISNTMPLKSFHENHTVTENCIQIWLTTTNVDYVLLNVDYVNEPMVFNSCNWNRHIHMYMLENQAHTMSTDCMPNAVVAIWLTKLEHINTHIYIYISRKKMGRKHNRHRFKCTFINLIRVKHTAFGQMSTNCSILYALVHECIKDSENNARQFS